jgi:hypothetical protein
LGQVWPANPSTRQNRIRERPIRSRRAAGATTVLNSGGKQSPSLAAGELLVGGKGPFHTDLQGGLARRSGGDGERAGRCPVVVVKAVTGRGGSGEINSGG